MAPTLDKFEVLEGFWVLWFVVWVAFALRASRSKEAEAGGSRAVHLAMMACAFTLLMTPYPRVAWLSIRFAPDAPAVAAAGIVILFSGMGFSVWARVLLGRNWSGRVTIKEGHELIDRGPYRLVRHPIYTGILAAMVGSAIVVGEVRGLIGVAIMAAAYIRKIPIEEAKLRQHFGGKYADYARRTWALVPYIL